MNAIKAAFDWLTVGSEIDPSLKRERRMRSLLFGCMFVALTIAIIWQGSVLTESQARRREATERCARIVQSAPVPIVVCDEHSTITVFNSEAEKLFGWDSAEVVGGPVDALIPTSGRAAHQKAFEKSLAALRAAKEDWQITRLGIEGTAVTKNGEAMQIIFYTRGYKYGDRIEFLATFRRETVTQRSEQGPIDFPKK